jgi:hypothetical protein
MGTVGQCFARIRWQYGSRSTNCTVSIPPSQRAARLKPPIPLNVSIIRSVTPAPHLVPQRLKRQPQRWHWPAAADRHADRRLAHVVLDGRGASAGKDLTRLHAPNPPVADRPGMRSCYRIGQLAILQQQEQHIGAESAQDPWHLPSQPPPPAALDVPPLANVTHSSRSRTHFRRSHASTLVPGHPRISPTPPVVVQSPWRAPLAWPVRLIRWEIALSDRSGQPLAVAAIFIRRTNTGNGTSPTRRSR